MKNPIDVPYYDRDKEAYSSRRFGGVPISFVERRINLAEATCEQLTTAASDQRAINFATGVVQDRDSNQYRAIYFIGCLDGFPLKIGIASSVQSRLSDLQVSHWQPLVVHGLLFAESRDALMIEQKSHKIAKANGILERGEWVWSSLPTAVDVVMEAAKSLKLKLMTPAMAFFNQGMAMKARDQAVNAADLRFKNVA